MTAVGVYHRSSDYLLNSQYIFEDWLFRVYTAVSMVRSETGLSRGKHTSLDNAGQEPFQCHGRPHPVVRCLS